MENTITVTLQPTDSGREYVTPHVLNLSSANDAGKTITFDAIESDFGVTIPNAITLFNTSEDTLTYSIRAGNSDVTPTIKSGLTPDPETPEAGREYRVYCEATGEYADKPDASPPIIIIRP